MKQIIKLYKLLQDAEHKSSGKDKDWLEYARNADRRGFVGMVASLQAVLLLEGVTGATGKIRLVTQGGVIVDVRNEIERFKDELSLSPNNHFLRYCLNQLAVLPRDVWNEIERLMMDFNHSPESIRQAIASCLCEGYGRDGRFYTPHDVTFAMWELAGRPNQVAVYSELGMGLLMGIGALPFPVSVELVGPGAVNDISLPIIRESNENLLDQGLQAIEQTRACAVDGKVAVLFVNAASIPNPFSSDEANAHKGYLPTRNHVLTAGYSKILVLVSNSMLSGGMREFNYNTVFKYCIDKGLRLVEELKDVVSRRAEKCSILVFEPNSTANDVTFGCLDMPTDDVANKFGVVRRNKGYADIKLLKSYQENRLASDLYIEPKSKIIQDSQKRKSFEPGKLIAARNRPSSRFVYKNLSEICDIYRVQYVEIDTVESDESTGYREIGASAIDRFGGISSSLERKYYASESKQTAQENKLEKGDILLCVKGSIGKVALVSDEPEEWLLPNQSFVRLRFKHESRQDGVTPELVFWWMRSKWAQEELSKMAVAGGVPRIPIKDIHGFQIPVGPANLLALEAQNYQNWKREVAKSLEADASATQIQKSNWS
jgi:hypothetical protein